jgi:hypothetical protein
MVAVVIDVCPAGCCHDVAAIDEWIQGNSGLSMDASGALWVPAWWLDHVLFVMHETKLLPKQTSSDL